MNKHTDPLWLRPLLGDEPGKTLLVGGVGHLLLNREEEAVVTAALEARVLPLLREMAGVRPITLFTGMAPGADVLLMDRATRWCKQNGVRLRKVGLSAVPVDQLVTDWIRRAESEGYKLSTADRHWLQSSVKAAFDDCDAVIDLYEHAPQMTGPHQPYQQLAAVLAEYADVLVAVLHDEPDGQPGGTAEVVAWRQQPDKLPRRYSTRPKPLRPDEDTGLIVVNPMPAKVTMSAQGGDARINKALQCAQAAIKLGNDLLANDILYRALQQGLRHVDLHHLRVQSLASIGSSELALREYEQLAPPTANQDERWLTLRGRIQKDLGLRSGVRRHFHAAAEQYLLAWKGFGSSYSAINAASMFLLSGDSKRAHEFAHKALKALQTETADTPQARFYAAATAAEASLILRDYHAMHRHLALANEQPIDPARRSRSVQQLRRLCEALGVSPLLLAPLRLPPLVLVRRLGRIESRAVADSDTVVLPSFIPADASIYVGICDRFDLLLAEALGRQGHALHLVLPYSAKRLVDGTRARHGDDWADRLERCLSRVAHVHAERGFLEHEMEWAAGNVTERALGLAVLAAVRSGGALQLIDVDPAVPEVGFFKRTDFSTVSAREALRTLHTSELPASASPGRRMVGLIFADFAGFQRLEDAELPHFWTSLMRGIAQLLVRHEASILLRSTWGDALHLVTADATTAAQLMADIQHYVQLHRLKPGSPLDSLTLRMAGHYAPAYEGHDPIHGARTYYGTQLSLAARIEPVTPPGQVYATEAFAARLAVEDSSQFSLEYTGEIELAKRFGAYRLYSLRRVKQ